MDERPDVFSESFGVNGTPRTTNCRASDGFLWVRPHEEEGPHDVMGRPVFWDHLSLRQEVPELCHDDFGCAKTLAEGSILRQRRPDSLAALILDVLANEEKIL